MKKMRSTQGRNAVEGPLERVLGASAGDSRDNQSYPEQRGRIPGRGEGREERGVVGGNCGPRRSQDAQGAGPWLHFLPPGGTCMCTAGSAILKAVAREGREEVVFE